MNRTSLLVLHVIIMLAVPGAGWACGLCIDSQMRYLMPTYYWILLTLLGWGFCHSQMGEVNSTDPGGGFHLRWAPIIKFVILSIGLIFMAMGSPAMIGVLLVGLYIGVCVRSIFATSISRRGRLFATVAGFVMMALLAAGLVQRFTQDPFDYARATTFRGTGIVRELATSYAKNPNFDLENLRPLIHSSTGNDREWAFEILRARRDKTDLELFKQEIQSLPPEFFEKDNYRDSSIMYFQMWMQALEIRQEDVLRILEEGVEDDASSNGQTR